MEEIQETWHKMSKKEAEQYWKKGIGQEIAYYDENIDKNKEIEMKEKQLKKLIEIGKLSKDEMKEVIDLEPLFFDILYARNKK